MFRYKVMEDIIYKGRELRAGRLIRAARDSASFFKDHFGDKVQLWEDWPNPSTEPNKTSAQIKQKNKYKSDGPNALEAEAWERTFKEEEE